MTREIFVILFNNTISVSLIPYIDTIFFKLDNCKNRKSLNDMTVLQIIIKRRNKLVYLLYRCVIYVE